ncbi:MAG TPA: nickel-dependent lactate racemase [Thermoflexia bacterium]|nr:nickel-dependent lactate racemase [Thermoflexia bacterium]
MRLKLAYGRDGLWVDLPDRNVTVVEPRFVAGLPDEKAAITQALRRPLSSLPLRELAAPKDTVAILFSDITRPTPNNRLLPPLLAELSHVPRKRITLINATGMHRANTEEELRGILGDAIVDGYRILQHDGSKQDELVNLGRTRFGHEILVNRAYAEATVKILTGFIEPHFFAGFSGGPKAVLPGVAGARLVLENHSAGMLDDPGATWGVTGGNPVWEEMLEAALKTAPTFLLNVTLNNETPRAITGIYAGDLRAAHQAGTAAIRQTAMVAVDAPFDIVITSNSGYPLDLNLYQAVKGMSAAAQVVREGGSIIVAAECWDGIPDHGEYKNILRMASSPQALLKVLRQPGFLMVDQWEAQLQAQIQCRADIYVRNSYLSDKEIRAALLHPCRQIEETLAELLARYGPDARICVLPEGPQTIPYIEGRQ